MFISTSDLKARLQDPNLVLIDTRSFEEYSEGHISGAVNLDLFSFHWSDTSEEGINAFNGHMKKIFSYSGVSQQKMVVFYDNVSGMLAARGVWLMQYFSHSQSFMLDGGFTKWKDEKLPIETKTNPFKPDKFEAKPNDEVIASFRYIKDNLQRIKIIDTRTREEYDGSIIRAANGGHIPNSINIDWILNIEDDGKMKNEQELSELYGQFSKDDEIVTYCQGAYRASNTFLALKKLGFKNVRVYLGSWAEWGNKLDLPVA